MVHSVNNLIQTSSEVRRILDHPFFAGMTSNDKALVCSAIEAGGAGELVYEAGEIIFHQGEPANRFYLIESGSVMLEVHELGKEAIPIQKLSANEVFGFSWLFPPFNWALQARAIERSILLILDGAHLLASAEQNKVFGYDLMKRAGQLAISRLHATRKQLVRVSKELNAIAHPSEHRRFQISES